MNRSDEPAGVLDELEEYAQVRRDDWSLRRLKILRAALASPPAPAEGERGWKEAYVDHLLRDVRGVETPCRRCGGWGRRAYADTTTWHGGIGGQTVTGDVCNWCWGSGDDVKKWPSHRLLAAPRPPSSPDPAPGGPVKVECPRCLHDFFVSASGECHTDLADFAPAPSPDPGERPTPKCPNCDTLLGPQEMAERIGHPNVCHACGADVTGMRPTSVPPAPQPEKKEGTT